jgi:PAS domain S-box-containing protein
MPVTPPAGRLPQTSLPSEGGASVPAGWAKGIGGPEAELDAARERLQLAIDAAELGTFDLDLVTGSMPIRSLRHDQMFGYETLQPEWGQATAERHVLEEDRPIFLQAYERALLTGRLAVEVRIRWPDGSIHWISKVGRTYCDAAGRPVRLAGVVADITERKRTEAALRESEERLRLALALGAIGVFEQDLVTGHLTWNEEEFRIYGIDPSAFEARYETWRSRLLTDDLAAVDATFAEAIAKRTPRVSTAFRIRRPSGEIRTLHAMVSISYAEDGTPLRFIGVNVDVTERVKAVENLRQSEERFRVLAQSTREGVVIHDGTRIVEANDAFLDMFGYARRSDVIGRQFLDVIAPSARAGVLARARAGSTVPYESIGLRADGTTFPVEFQGRDMMYLGRSARVGVMRDLTAQRRAEAALRESEERLRLAQEAAGVGMWDFDLRRGVSVCSETYCRIFGLDPTSQGHCSFEAWLAQVHAEDRERVGVAASAAFTAGTYECEYRILRPDGTVRWISARGTTKFDAAGVPERFIGLCTDITALRESELRLRLAIEGTGFATWDFDIPSGTAVWSANHFTAFGYPPDPAGRSSFAMWRDRIHPEDWPAVQKVRETASPVAPFRMLYRIRRADDGEERWMETTGRVIETGPEGRPRRTIGITLDVTERQRLEADLRQGQKLQALGQLAGGVAHDFNNVLQAVMGGVRLVEKHAAEPEAVRRYAAQLLQSVERGAAITRRLLVLARRSDLDPQRLDVPAMFEGLKAVLGPTLGPALAIRIEIEPGLPPLLADKAQLETTLINLAANARDAMPQGGTLTLAACVAAPLSAAQDDEKQWIRLSVRDTGTGMDAATLARVAEPFFSTKPPEQGTGLGVPMAKAFAEQSGGYFAVESAPGRGTVASLWLPQAESGPGPDGRRSEVAEEEAAQRASLRVLVVDDDTAVLETIAADLRVAGAMVFTASSGAEALARLTGDPLVDAVVVDLAMPGMDGLSLIRKVRESRPRLPAVLLTGYAGEVERLLAAGSEGGPFALLAKPSSGDQVADTLAALVADRLAEDAAR